MANPAQKKATYEDLFALPEHMVGEIVHGALHAHPRPAMAHAAASAALGEELGPPFKRGRGGPGGWIILDEPELHLGEHVLVPDLAGWRRERMPMLEDAAYISMAPDWICEVLSPSGAKLDRSEKLPISREHDVKHAWLVDPRLRTLEVLRGAGAHWVIVGVHKDNARVRAEPFDAIELELGILWADVVLTEG